MDHQNHQVCFICLETTLQHVSLRAPLGSGTISCENNENDVKKFTYLECLCYCSKLEFNFDENDIETLCYGCAQNLQKTYHFLLQVNDAHERMLIIEKEANLDEIAEDEQLLFDAQTIEMKDANDADAETILESDDEHANDDSVEQSKIKQPQTDDCSDAEQEDVIEMLESDEKCNGKLDLKCSLCDEKFEYMRFFRLHWRNVHKMEPTSFCQVCCTFLDEEINLRDHLKSQHTNIVSCDECDYQCVEKLLAKHKLRAHSTRAYECEQCLLKYATRGQLETHLKNHQNKPVICNICKKKIACKRYLTQHKRIMHNIGPKRTMYKCTKCDRKYASKGSLNMHMRLHLDKAFSCKVCQKKVISFSELKVHMRFHTGEYPEMCDICGKKYATKGNLKEHMWTHQGLKLKCDKCDKSFSSHHSLKQHMYTHFGMPYTCPHCGKSYPSVNKYKVHLKSAHLICMSTEELVKTKNHIESVPKIRVEKHLVQVANTENKNNIENMPAKKKKMSGAKVKNKDYSHASDVFLVEFLPNNSTNTNLASPSESLKMEFEDFADCAVITVDDDECLEIIELGDNCEFVSDDEEQNVTIDDSLTEISAQQNTTENELDINVEAEEAEEVEEVENESDVNEEAENELNINVEDMISVWNDAACKLLVSIADKIKPKLNKTSQYKTKTKMWIAIKKQMAAQGYAFSALQIENKYRYLERQQKKQQNKQNNANAPSAKTCLDTFWDTSETAVETSCDIDAAISSDDDDDDELRSVWQNSACKLLISLVGQIRPQLFKSVKFKNKTSMWKEIAKQMSEQGYNFSALQVDNKFRNMERKFKKYQGTTKTYRYEKEFNDMYLGKTEILAVANDFETICKTEIDLGNSCEFIAETASETSWTTTHHSAVEKPTETSIWLDSGCKLLISLVAQIKPQLFKSRKLNTKSKMWRTISTLMAEQGYKFSALQVENKYRYLERQFRKTLEPGNTGQKCRFHKEFTDMLNGRPIAVTDADDADSETELAIPSEVDLATFYDASLVSSRNPGVWPDEACKLLVSLANKIQPKLFKCVEYKNKTKMWRQIEKEMAEHGYSFSVQQIENKYRYLVRQYKKSIYYST